MPIESAFGEFSTSFSKLADKHFNGKFIIEIAFWPIENISFFEYFFTGFLIINESTDLASILAVSFYVAKFAT